MLINEMEVCVAVRRQDGTAVNEGTALVPKYDKGRIVAIQDSEAGVPVGAYVAWTTAQPGWTPTVAWHSLSEACATLTVDRDDAVTRFVLDK